MPVVNHCATPPPLVEEENGEVRVTGQLEQLAMTGFTSSAPNTMKLLGGAGSQILLPLGSSLVVRQLDTDHQTVQQAHR